MCSMGHRLGIPDPGRLTSGWWLFPDLGNTISPLTSQVSGKDSCPCCLSLGTSFKLLVLCSQLTPCNLSIPSSSYWYSNHWLGTWRPASSLPSCSHPSTMTCALETSIKYFPFSLFYDLKLLHYLSTWLPCVQLLCSCAAGNNTLILPFKGGSSKPHNGYESPKSKFKFLSLE